MYSAAPSKPVQSPLEPPNANAAARRLLIGLLIATSVVVQAALYAGPSSEMSLHSLAFFGIGLGQVALVIAWAMLTRTFSLLRVIVTVGVIASFALLLTRHFPRTWPEFLGLLLIYSLGVAIPILGLRLAGLRLEAGEVPNEARVPAGAAWRYSLGGLFAVTTSIAIFAALVRVTELPGEHVRIVLAYASAFALVSLGAMTPLVVRQGPYRPVVLMLLATLAAPVLGALAGALEGPPELIAWLTFCQALFLTAAVWVLRSAGYRAVWYSL